MLRERDQNEGSDAEGRYASANSPFRIFMRLRSDNHPTAITMSAVAGRSHASHTAESNTRRCPIEEITSDPVHRLPGTARRHTREKCGLTALLARLIAGAALTFTRSIESFDRTFSSGVALIDRKYRAERF